MRELLKGTAWLLVGLGALIALGLSGIVIDWFAETDGGLLVLLVIVFSVGYFLGSRSAWREAKEFFKPTSRHK